METRGRRWVGYGCVGSYGTRTCSISRERGGRVVFRNFFCAILAIFVVNVGNFCGEVLKHGISAISVVLYWHFLLRTYWHHEISSEFVVCGRP